MEHAKGITVAVLSYEFIKSPPGFCPGGEEIVTPDRCQSLWTASISATDERLSQMRFG